MLKVEKVVKEPKNPVPIINEKDSVSPKPVTTPSMSVPHILTKNVATGNELVLLRFIQFELNTRAKTPKAAPIATNTILPDKATPPFSTGEQGNAKTIAEYTSNQTSKKTYEDIDTRIEIRAHLNKGR